MRFLHTADWQLGMTRHFLSPDAQPRYSAARRAAITALGSVAEEHDAEFVVVAGAATTKRIRPHSSFQIRVTG